MILDIEAQTWSWAKDPATRCLKVKFMGEIWGGRQAGSIPDRRNGKDGFHSVPNGLKKSGTEWNPSLPARSLASRPPVWGL